MGKHSKSHAKGWHRKASVKGRPGLLAGMTADTLGSLARPSGEPSSRPPQERRHLIGNRRTGAVVLTAFGLAALGASPAMADHINPWDRSWPKTGPGPIEVPVVDSTSPEWKPRLQGAVEKWNENPDIKVSIEPGENDLETRQKCERIKGAVHVCDDDLGDDGDRGGAAYEDAPNGTPIESVRLKLNNYYLDKEPEEVKQHDMCHELGHSLGLAHQYAAGTCMNDKADGKDPDPDEPWQPQPNEHDFEQLKAMYGPGSDEQSDGRSDERSSVSDESAGDGQSDGSGEQPSVSDQSGSDEQPSVSDESGNDEQPPASDQSGTDG
ncbi:M43 family zinc metalloprotease [Streptomyces sp.]|uniref:M43 family zinc metalloprotease n=1 Tax=Streptomyces sp. TaxID=1931 RepID=UPI002D76809B|nr:M43 family zinc metalloprotease [Streptomyces sp.]HET6356026.1 M43 family zinc metalloprotease [Streptomyces sp.]